MKFEKIISRQMPDGVVRRLRPFHISFEGLETNVICRDDEDCDVMVKQLCICGRRMNVVIVAYGVVSNHAHIVILAESYDSSKEYAFELKRVYSLYFHQKYKGDKVLARTDVDVREIDSDWYLRNAIAYDIANALDTGSRIEDYKWTSYRAMFSSAEDAVTSGCLPVSELSVRMSKEIFRSKVNLKNSRWMIDRHSSLVPSSVCYHKYAEAAFGNDIAFFMRVLGTVNKAEMHLKLSGKRMCDQEFLPMVNVISERWFSKDVDRLSLAEKTRLLPYTYRSHRTSVSQLARIFHVPKAEVAKILGISVPDE